VLKLDEENMINVLCVLSEPADGVSRCPRLGKWRRLLNAARGHHGLEKYSKVSSGVTVDIFNLFTCSFS
jgi:hypothetical protein